MKKIVATDKGLEAQLNQNFASLERAVDQALAHPFAQGQFIKRLTLPVGVETEVPHALGRPYQHFWQVRLYRGAATTWMLMEGNSKRPAESIVLLNGCDADITIDLFIC